jgi:N-acetylglucosaminyldiphosphoundecaprenol N-acetyl-beta-D-mannosaminyltransferase
MKDIPSVASGEVQESLWMIGQGLCSRSPSSAFDQEGTNLRAFVDEQPKDLSREVYCVLGIPIDAIEMTEVLRRIEIAAAKPSPLLISTPNLYFLVTCLKDPEFRESLLLSDLCTADGMPIVWIARLLGIPIKKRVAGSDTFATLRARVEASRPLKVFFFGATEETAAAAARALNFDSSTLKCVGWTCPGFGTVEDMSSAEFIDAINASDADFLVAALGARKGQLWLMRNHHRLRIPVRAHLGATINFHAGTIKRAPHLLQILGLEWLWRIAQEPHLWRRYCHDGAVLLRLLLTRVLPLAIGTRLQTWRPSQKRHNLVIEVVQGSDLVTLRLCGNATADQVEVAIDRFRFAVSAKVRVVLDFAKTRAVDARFLGLLLMLRKQLKAEGRDLELTGISPRMERIFRRNEVGFLLSKSKS